MSSSQLGACGHWQNCTAAVVRVSVSGTALCLTLSVGHTLHKGKLRATMALHAGQHANDSLYAGQKTNGAVASEHVMVGALH